MSDRPPKSKKTSKPVHPTDSLFALGKSDIIRKAGSSSAGVSSSTSSSSRSSSLPGGSSKSSGSSSSSIKHSTSDKKREHPGSSSHSSSSSSVTKKLKTQHVGSSSAAVPVVPKSSGSLKSVGSSSALPSVPSLYGSTSGSVSTPIPVIKSAKPLVAKRDEVADDFSVDNFLSTIENESGAPSNTIQNLIVQAIKNVKNHGSKTDPRLCMGLMRGSILNPLWFQSNSVVDYITSLLSTKKVGSDVRSRFFLTGSPVPPFLVCLLTNAYAQVPLWPVQFFQAWIEDACNDRIWVDRPQCKAFTENILHSFNTVQPDSSLLQATDGAATSSGTSSPLNVSGEDTANFDEAFELSDEEDIPVLDRVGSSTALIENIVMDCFKDIVSKKTGDLPKSLFKALGTCCGLSAVQTYVLSRMDIWIHNQKTGKYASDLLLYLCCNVNAETDGDHVTQILKMRYKQKQLVSSAALAIKEMVLQNETNMRAVLNSVIVSELSTAKNQINIPVLSVCMASVPGAPQLMAEIILDQMTRREETHGSLRILLRDTVRITKYEFDLRSFVTGLTQLRMEHEIVWKDEAFKERCFVIITDLIMLCMFLNVTSQVRDYAMLKGDPKDTSSIIVFQNTVAHIQEAAISWMYHVVPQMFKPSKKEFGTALSKLLLRDPMNDFVVRDNWPPEGERSIFARMCLDVPIRESALLYTLMMGISKQHPLNRPEILDIVEVWIMQAAQREGNLKLAKPEIFKGLFQLCEYTHPESIVLPSGYDPPLLAISRLYWKVWILLCVISAHNPATLGKIMWEAYPTLRAIMEMCMTGHFSFPTPSTADSAEELSMKEMQLLKLEQSSIIEFEQHLASASSKQQITEKNSLLLPQLMRLDPHGIPRSPPQAVLSQLRSVNEQLHLGQLLCRSRNPDFLLDLMQNNSQPMPWLYELVAEGPIDILPVQCLCELMLSQVNKISRLVELEASGDKVSKKLKTTEDAKNMQILRHLQKRVLDAESTDGSSKEIVEYFLRKLCSAKRMNRQQALQGLQLILSPSASSKEENWLVDVLPTAPVFSHIRSISIACLRQAFVVETEPMWLSRYLEYLSVWINVDHEDMLAGLTIDVANFVVERNGVFQVMLRHFPKTYDPLFEIFTRYIKRVQTPTKENIQLSEDKDQILVQWTDEKREASLNIIIVHAIVMTMTEYSRNGQSDAIKAPQDVQKPKTLKGKTAEEAKFQELLNIWFPANSLSLRAYELSTMEDVILFPDWLKSKMISTNDRRLVSAALEGADSDQLILYVQCFGIPVTAMKCLLNCLDTVFKNQPNKKIDPAKLKYLKALVEAQPLRGATGGEEFLKRINRQLAEVESSMEAETAFVGRRVRKVMPAALSKKSKSVAKPNLALEPNCKREETVVARLTEPLRLEGPDNDKAIRQLSKELLNTLSLGNRRRSSAPTEDSPVQVSTVVMPRRHSMFVDKPEALTVNVSLEGPILDKFVELEPSIVKTAVDMQTQLIFERSISPLRCRPFLLNALAHQSSWKSVGFCIEFFMKTCDTKYDPTNVLDLVAATVKNPALWHGGDKFIPKHQPEMPMIHLNRQQLLVLAEYIIEEVSCTVIKNAKFSISNLLGSSTRSTSGKTAKPKQKLKERVRLWLVCCKHEKELVNSIIKELLATKNTNPHAKKFLAQLYLEFPEAMLGRTWRECDEIVMNDEDLSSNLDTISFNLVNATALNEPGKDWLRKAQHHLEPALRKLALTHPVLLLRQLPMMCTLLEGRVHLDFNVFQAQNQHIPFKVFLGLWEFMLPHILKHFKVVKNAFMLYFKLFENFAHMKDFSLEIRRLSVLLHNFWQKNSIETEEFLKPHHKLLVNMGGLKNYIDVSPLHNLIETIVPPQDRRSYIAPVNGFRDPTGTHGRNDLEADTIMVFLDRMQHVTMVDDMYPILQDLDMASNRNPAILSSFSEKLKTLLTCNNEACRTLSLSLVLKHMTYAPKCQNVYFDTIMTLLRSENPQIRECAIERIPEFVMISHEHAEDILMRLFDLGVTANINVQPAISRTLAIFRSYTGT